MRRVLVFTLMVAGGACGDNTGGDAIGVSGGTRLRPTFLAASGGARLFTGWFDTQERAACDFVADVNGTYRCLPGFGSAAFFDSDRYGDAGCTQHVIAEAPGQADATYAVQQGEGLGTCALADARRVFEIGAVHDGDGFYFIDGACQPFNNQNHLVMHDVGPEVDPGRFVSAELVLEDGGDVSPYAFHAADGAREVTGMWDQGRDAECNYDQSIGECVPTEVTLGGVFADASCNHQIAVDTFVNRTCVEPTAMVSFEDGPPKYFEIGAKVAAGPVFRIVDGTCAQSEGEAPVAAYEVGVEITSFPSLDEVQDGTGRIRALRAAGADGAALRPAFALFDTQVGEVCQPKLFTDGTTRCTTTSLQTGTLFSDSACTAPLAIYDSSGPPPDVVLVMGQAPDVFSEAPVASAHVRGPDFDGQVFNATAGGCVAFPPEDLKFAQPGDELELPILAVE